MPAVPPVVPAPAARTGLAGAALVAAALVLGLVLAAVVVGVLVRGAADDAGRAAGEAVGESMGEALHGALPADPFAIGGTLGAVEQSEPVPPGEPGPDPVLDGSA